LCLGDTYGYASRIVSASAAGTYGIDAFTRIPDGLPVEAPTAWTAGIRFFQSDGGASANHDSDYTPTTEWSEGTNDTILSEDLPGGTLEATIEANGVAGTCLLFDDVTVTRR